jgi:hypothetical protein
MLINTELDTMHPHMEYFRYIKSITRNDRDILKTSREFDEWLFINKNQLNDIYKNMREKPSPFLKWARKRFYLWRYNQEKKKLRSEIDDLINI